MTGGHPPIALTMGDPAGVGPDITVTAWRTLKDSGPVFFVIGDPALYGDSVQAISAPEEAAHVFPDALPVLPLALAASVVRGKPDTVNAAAIIASIEQAVALTVSGQAAAVVTNPISKAVLKGAGFTHPGHTEFVADLLKDLPQQGPRGPVMMLAGDGLRVVLATIHMPLKDAIAALTPGRICDVARVTLAALTRDFGIAQPRLAIAGLNPHAGEDGHIGREEIDIVRPAADRLRAEGHDVTGPLPPDGMFHAEARARYDAALCLYHDQGLIPLKTLDFWGGVNVTLGLPVVRTSPDHGTAFDIAGTGMARADSLINAIRLASDTAHRRASSA